MSKLSYFLVIFFTTLFTSNSYSQRDSMIYKQTEAGLVVEMLNDSSSVIVPLDEDSLIHGEVIIRKRNKVLYSINYFKGTKDGVETHFYSSGEKKRIIEYNKGITNDTVYTFYRNGNIEAVEFYREGFIDSAKIYVNVPQFITYKADSILQSANSFEEFVESLSPNHQNNKQ